MTLDAQVVQEMLDQMGFLKHGAETRLDGIVVGHAVAHYQRAFAGKSHEDWLKVDGIAGPKTLAKLDQWEGMLAPNFAASEFTDRRSNVNAIRRELVHGLQLLRNRTGRPMAVLSGYRTEQTNAAVGGATQSLHLQGLAADIQVVSLTLGQLTAMRVFSGIGYALIGKGRQLVIRHVDVRHVNPRLHHPGTPAKPQLWRY